MSSTTGNYKQMMCATFFIANLLKMWSLIQYHAKTLMVQWTCIFTPETSLLSIPIQRRGGRRLGRIKKSSRHREKTSWWPLVSSSLFVLPNYEHGDLCKRPNTFFNSDEQNPGDEPRHCTEYVKDIYKHWLTYTNTGWRNDKQKTKSFNEEPFVENTWYNISRVLTILIT